MQPKRHYRKKRIAIIAFSVLVLLAIYFFQDSSFILRAITTVGAIALFCTLDHVYDIRFENRHYVFMVAILCATVLASPIYFLHPQYDKIQHFLVPILLASMAFFMVNKLNLERKWKLWFAFFITVAILGLFELGEYTLDQFFDFKLQGVFLRDISGLNKLNVIQEPLDDTMMDMFLGVLGTTLYGAYKSIRLKR
jgi:hypothetical protein